MPLQKVMDVRSRVSRRVALQTALDILSVDWISKHLLESSPAHEAAILLSPLQQLNSLAFAAVAENVATDPQNVTSLMSMHSECIIVPAFSCDGYTAGYFVEDLQGRLGIATEFCPTGLNFIRFVMNERDSTLLFCIKNSTEENTVLTIISPNCRSVSSSCIAFHDSDFAALAKGQVRSLSAYERTIKTVISANVARNCLVCGANRTVPCSCSFMSTRARYSLDFSTFKQNILNHLGNYEGSGFHERFENGQLVELNNVSANHSTMRIGRQGCAPRLFKWAITRALLEQPARVARILSDPFESENTLDDELPFHSIVSSTLSSLPEFSAPSIQKSATPKLHENTLATAHIDLSYSRVPLPCQRTKTSSLALAFTGTMEGISDPNNLWDPLDALPPVIATSSDILTQNPDEVLLGIPATSAPDFISGFNPGSANQPIPNMSRDTHVLPALTPAAALLNLPAPAVSVAPVFSNALPIVPGPMGVAGLNAATTKATREEDMQKNTEEIRKWKAYQRKIRNRESAARSNQARKQRRLELSKKQQQQESAATQVHFCSAVS